MVFLLLGARELDSSSNNMFLILTSLNYEIIPICCSDSIINKGLFLCRVFPPMKAGHLQNIWVHVEEWWL